MPIGEIMISPDQTICGVTSNLNVENVAHEFMKIDGQFKDNTKKITDINDSLNRMANDMNEMKRDIKKLLKKPSR